MSNLGPHAQRVTPEGLGWAQRAAVVAQIDGTELLQAAPADAVLLFRHYFASQALTASPEWVAGEILSALRGYRHPHLYVQVYVGVSGAATTEYTRLLRQVVPLLHKAGVKVAGPSWYTGDYDEAAWQAMRAAKWCGLDAVCLQAYWADAGLTPWNALRYRTYWRPGAGDPPLLIIGECGRDRVRDGPNGTYVGKGGWKADGISAQQAVRELVAFDAELEKDGVLGVVFTSGPYQEWLDYNTDELDTSRFSGPARGVGKVANYESPNHDGPRPQTRGIVLHSTRGGAASLDAEYQATLNWFASPASGVSAHAVVGPNGEVAYPVADNLIAWHARSYNQSWLGIELVQSRPGQPIPAPCLAAAARVVAQWCVKYKVPIVWSTTRGLAEHREIPPGTQDRKTDIGPGFDRAAFLQRVKEEAWALAPKPILNVGELSVFPTWSLARLQNKQDFRGAAGLAAFREHLKALGCDAGNPARYGWPG